jgi:dienelactone hydrolase
MVQWHTPELQAPPQTYPAPGFEEAGVEPLFFEGLPWRGEATRVFAWLGMPVHKPGDKVPGIVLVHGGGGTAFVEWVRLWTSRGYAAIALDTCGCTAGGEPNRRPRHDRVGPPGWGGFDQVDEPVEDQWPYHAVAGVVLAHSLLRSRDEVDATKIGITGISWGGYLSCIAAGVDDRFAFVAPVYGCGFLGDDSKWKAELDRMGERGRKWLRFWDPAAYLPRARMPFLWVTGTNDLAYPLPSHQKSYRLTSGTRVLSIRRNMPHAHGGPGENPKEIHAFADSIVKGGPPLSRVGIAESDGVTARVVFDSSRPVVAAQLLYTRDDGAWTDRHWESAPARLEGKAAAAVLPPGTTAWYFNVTDDRDLIISSELQRG